MAHWTEEYSLHVQQAALSENELGFVGLCMMHNMIHAKGCFEPQDYQDQYLAEGLMNSILTILYC